ncbi:MAG: peptidylprolyl isomerase [Burkholderiales bacterium]|nr:peptidylprolyl isomerase [Burkholderiales bacterium]
MSISVNGIEITDADIEQELVHHAEAPNPVKAATEALVLRQALLQATQQAGLIAHNANEEDAIIERLLAQEVKAPTPTEEECRRYYSNHPARFRSGDLVEASHILFQVTDKVPLDALRQKAQEILARVLDDPAAFEQCARDYSNCPSGDSGGNLGQLTRGQTVPEFERAIFALAAGEIADRLVETRFGLHIVRVARKVEGAQLPFELVQTSIARFLTDYAKTKATRQYLEILVGQMDIQGVELSYAATPLVQ